MASPTALSSFGLASLQRLAKISGDDVFRILVVGEEGLGKSTIVGSLLQPQLHGACLEHFADGAWQPVDALPGGSSTEEIRRYRFVFEEQHMGVAIRNAVEILDTPGFATQINNANSWMSKVEEIEKRMQSFHDRGSHCRLDDRVHMCLYVLPPSSRRLKQLDKRVMIEMQRLVPVLPIIAKSDTFDAEGLATFQRLLQREFDECGILPVTGREGFPLSMTCELPLSIIASSKAYQRSSKGGWAQCELGAEGAVRGRLYRWGLAECDASSDLPILRQIITQYRYFIMEECEWLYSIWKNARQWMIDEMANGLAEINAFEQKMRVWQIENGQRLADHNSVWCPSRFVPHPQPQLGSLGDEVRGSDADKLHAEALWQKAFKDGQQNMANLKADIESLVLTGGMAHSTWLQEVRKNIVQRQLDSLLAADQRQGQAQNELFANGRDRHQFLRKRIYEGLESPLFNLVFEGLILAEIAGRTGIPNAVVKTGLNLAKAAAKEIVKPKEYTLT